MRDIALTLFIVGLLPIILKLPHIGVLAWSWLGYMNPHRYSWGFAYNMPFAQIVAITMFVGILFSKEKKSFPINRTTVVWMLFIIWTIISTMFSFDVADSMAELDRFLKIQIVVACTLLLMVNKERIIQLVWVIVFSIGFFGVKGGVFSIVTGLQFRIGGPPDSFIEGNNEIALAILMVIPLMYFLWRHTKSKYIRLALLASMFFCAIAVIGSYSRGAFLAGIVTLFFLWIGMKKKLLPAVIVISLIIAALPFIPEQWYSRMDTIETYQEDASALGRINAWYTAFYMANDNPLTGGGLRAFGPQTFAMYAPNPDAVHDAHSIYFEVLGEMGYVGILLFLLLWFFVYREAKFVYRETRTGEGNAWMADLAKMTQVSLIAYLSGGAFLGLAFFDLPYHLMCLAVLPGVILRKQASDRGGSGGHNISL